MAELDVQPKSRYPWWSWMIAAIVILLLVFLFRSCGDTAQIVSEKTGDSIETNKMASPKWADVDFNAPATPLDEISDSSISVRGNDKYTIYGFGENILFESGQDQVQRDAKEKLNQVSKSIERRFRNYWIAVYGNTDSDGNADENIELSRRRAESVKVWLVENAGVPTSRIFLRPMGEKSPASSNSTKQGRKINRRVEIVVMKP